ncbi:lipopolysaccharide biosynthesis protein [Rhodococcus sp. AD45-ID]|uniref:lipopolysaccharide biosynthesis protein n=1 Tax=unclassified Rhodococcus (in: high G+C Gram-positive bacteria) TaxID=192944 RepID=UPI0005D403EF|nr:MULTISPECIES: lipopolysaccharide biosynthesis protein [unclassified Rhodococcus (in: high G+C Gram-positive bacteria)]KJF23456.1 Lipopolysaccharide biosynthesis protein wzxC [Rhodococcus sp. AD45]PSR41893.1 lipopolysaccharide biosynthesis protein [Rhodococcus sp. AD45-ID]
MTLAQSAARGSAITLLSQAIKLVIMLGSTIILARLLSPTDYGLVAMVVALIGVAEVFRDFGLSMAALQSRTLTHQQQSNLFWINTLVGAILTILVFSLAAPISSFYSEPALLEIVRALSITFLLGGLSTQFKVSINRDLRFFALAAVDLLPFVFAFVVALSLALTVGNFWALVSQQITLALLGLVASVVFSKWRPGLPRRADMGNLLTFGISYAATQLISYGTRNVDSIALGRSAGASSLGMYDRAYSLVSLPLTQINTPLSRVAIPILSRLADQPARFFQYLRRAQLVALYLTASVFLLLAAIGDQLVLLLLGPDWEVAGQILRILAISGVFRSIVQIVYWIYMSLGLAKQQLRYYLVAQPLLIVVILCGLPWGAMGVAVAVSIGYALNWLGALLWVGHVAKIRVRPLLTDAARAVLGFGLPAGLLAWGASAALASTSPTLRLLVGCTSAAIGYFIAWAVSKRVREDMSVLVSFARKAVGRE